MAGSELERMAGLLKRPAGAAWGFAVPGAGEEGTGEEGVVLPPRVQAAGARRQSSYRNGRRAAARALAAAGVRGKGLVGQRDDGLPDWPAGWTGSISHTDRMAAAIVAPKAGAVRVGLDLEQLLSASEAAEIAHDIAPELTGREPPFPHALAVTLSFSAKEALYKALYPETRQFREFSAARIDWVGGGGALPFSARLTLTEDWGQAWPRGAVLAADQLVADGHVLSLVWR